MYKLLKCYLVSRDVFLCFEVCRSLKRLRKTGLNISVVIHIHLIVLENPICKQYHFTKMKVEHYLKRKTFAFYMNSLKNKTSIMKWNSRVNGFIIVHEETFKNKYFSVISNIILKISTSFTFLVDYFPLQAKCDKNCKMYHIRHRN